MTDHVRVTREGRRTIVGIDRPEAHKALNAAAHRALAAAFDDFAAAADRWGAIASGDPRHAGVGGRGRRAARLRRAADTRVAGALG